MINEKIHKIITSKPYLLGLSEALIILGALALGASLFGNIPPSFEKGFMLILGFFCIFGGSYCKYLLEKTPNK